MSWVYHRCRRGGAYICRYSPCQIADCPCGASLSNSSDMARRRPRAGEFRRNILSRIGVGRFLSRLSHTATGRDYGQDCSISDSQSRQFCFERVIDPVGKKGDLFRMRDRGTSFPEDVIGANRVVNVLGIVGDMGQKEPVKLH